MSTVAPASWRNRLPKRGVSGREFPESEAKEDQEMEKKDNKGPAGLKELIEYLVDAGQRTVLFWDVMRQRGNQYEEHMAQTAPHVLQFEHELILDGRKLPRPVNYGIVKIRPPKGTVINSLKRPFVVIDPRAGHGPGIGGFKADSEIGEALRAGHPCYFIGFTPIPEPGQTIEAVIEAWAVFIERVAELHAGAEGKPVAIGNCQAGWALMMLAAKRPELCGPIIVAGSPLSYWAGVRGVNPMRYTGGLLGGSWLTALVSDLGHGKFDGAWLVQNFENLNPANTLWAKQYNLYANIDTEAPRYLGFERWWGGHVILSGEEMQYIVDNLFVGNRLSSAEMVTADGVQLDLRKIRSPIVCFCSKGDNITPPQQALGWILDLYRNDEDILAAGQTIVYAVHETVGHLGIFVSGGIAKKEHQEFAGNIDLIDCLPPGLYEAVIQKKTPDAAHAELVSGDYIARFERRSLEDIRALGGNSLDDERCFAAVARLSEAANGVYRTAVQPLVRGLATEQTAEWLRRLHPLRLGYELFSDRNPAAKALASAAEQVRGDRRPTAADNPFLQWEKAFSDWMTESLDAFRDWRDLLMEQTFFGIYSQPWLQALLGLRASDEPPRHHPGGHSDHAAFVERRIEELRAKMDKGGPREAALRALIYVGMPDKGADEREFEMLRRIRAQHGAEKSLAEFKQDLREQYYMLRIDESRAIALIPKLLQGHKDQGPQLLEYVRRIVYADGSLSEEGQRRLAQVEQLFAAEQEKSARGASKKYSGKKGAV
jgi:pimeloyl-ACP methyl ester carboxylesterase